MHVFWPLSTTQFLFRDWPRFSYSEVRLCARAIGIGRLTHIWARSLETSRPSHLGAISEGESRAESSAIFLPKSLYRRRPACRHLWSVARPRHLRLSPCPPPTGRLPPPHIRRPSFNLSFRAGPPGSRRPCFLYAVPVVASGRPRRLTTYIRGELAAAAHSLCNLGTVADFVNLYDGFPCCAIP
jgi:hypothetical protein